MLTDNVIEDIKSRCCIVGEAMKTGDSSDLPVLGDDSSDIEVPSSDATQSESEFSVPTAPDSVMSSHASDFSVVSSARVLPSEHPRPAEGHLQALATMYGRQSTASDLEVRVTPPVSQQTGTGNGIVIIPGWIRERAAEFLFTGGDVDEKSVAQVILDSMLKVRLDNCSFHVISHMCRFQWIFAKPWLPRFSLPAEPLCSQVLYLVYMPNSFGDSVHLHPPLALRDDQDDLEHLNMIPTPLYGR